MTVELVLGVLNQLPNVSDETLVKLSYPLERLMGKDGQGKKIIQTLRRRVQEKQPILTLLRRMIRDLNPNAKRALANWMVITFAERKKALRTEQEHGVYPPLSILISPTMRCNLDCIGCYAGRYTKSEELPESLVRRILDECRELGTHWITFSGGEPFIYKPFLDIVADYKDMVFQVYTNGTFINDKVADRLAELGNVAPNISLEGFQDKTDARRGPGIFKKVMDAMDRLHERGVFFGTSLTSTAMNYKDIVDERFIDLLVEKGALNIWLFNYIPVGSKANLGLMPTPQQRNYVRMKTNYLRRTKPILIVDFWSNGSWVGGCQSAGRGYLHINSRGEVEPCVFNHFAVDNIKEKSLLEVLKSPFFTAIRKEIPFSENTLRPCPIIDHPAKLREVVKKYGAHPTDSGAEAFLTDFAEGLDSYSAEVAEIYNEVWERHEKYWVDWWLGDAPEEPPPEEMPENLEELIEEPYLQPTFETVPERVEA